MFAAKALGVTQFAGNPVRVSVSGMRLAVVIPTRNRSHLALRALSSVVPQIPPGSAVVVSDNSTDVDHRRTVRAHVERLARDDVQYRRPPHDLAMPAHWEWAFSQIASLPDITHCTILTDRMIFKRGAIGRLDALIAEDRHAILSYNHDVVDDYSSPVKLLTQAWTGTTLTLASEDLLGLAAAMEHHSALPRMLNCIVPVPHLDRLRAAFGSVFDSVAPDFCFAFRTLAQVDFIRYVDEALLVHGALAHSNGASYARGQSSPDHADFVAKLGGLSLNHAAPVPEFATVANTVVSEYELVRRQTGLPRFVPVDMDAYFAKMAREISEIQNPSVAKKMSSLLMDRWADFPSSPTSAWPAKLHRLSSRGPHGLIREVLAAGVSSAPTRRLWKWAGARPPRTRWFNFSEPEEAFEFAQSPGRRPARTHRELRVLQRRSGGLRSPPS